MACAAARAARAAAGGARGGAAARRRRRAPARAAGAAAPPAGAVEAKEALLAAVARVETFGIFGCKPDERDAIAAAAEALEACAFVEAPAAEEALAQHVAGDWAVLYSTVKILGSKRTKLGLRGGVVTIDSLVQSIDTEERRAANVVHFSLAGLGAAASGTLTVSAAYSQAEDESGSGSNSRVNITYEESRLEPEALERLLGANMDLLLQVFNPEGWLDITYVDDDTRLGRDDKGNLYVLQRM